jgi:hypothetical protein
VFSESLATYVNTFFEDRLRNLFALAELVETAFASAGLDYAVIGGLAAYLSVEERCLFVSLASEGRAGVGAAVRIPGCGPQLPTLVGAGNGEFVPAGDQETGYQSGSRAVRRRLPQEPPFRRQNPLESGFAGRIARPTR